MIALLGPPPKQLLARSDALAGVQWPNAVKNETGRLCSNGREYFDGPFFNENGRQCRHLKWIMCLFPDLIFLTGEFLHDDLLPTRKLEDSITTLEEEERQAFLSFVNHMLAWLPEDRQTAGELMEHPFLNG
jgi:serine/threonine protein kinase